MNKNLPQVVSDLAGWSSAWAPLHDDVRKLLSDAKVRVSGDQRHAARFRDAMISWLRCNRRLDFSGCERKKQWAYCNGIHDALIQQIAYRRDGSRQFYVFADDYRFYQDVLRPHAYHVITWADLHKIRPHSYVIVSWPNHDGMMDTRLRRLIRQCQETDSLIFLDCAFMGTIMEGVCDTSLPVFDAVAVSVSKAFHCAGLRAGLVWGDDLSPTLTVPMHETYSLYNATSAALATRVIENLSADWLPSWFVPLQQQWCMQNGFMRTDVCLFARSSHEAYAPWFRQGGSYLRVCISDIYR